MLLGKSVQRRSSASLPRWAACALLLAMASHAEAPRFPEEGAWRGEFDVNGDKLPFNFELKGKGDGTVLTLVNGSRRDAFFVTQPTPDSIFVRMNTYDAALVATLQPDGRLVGAYKSLVPNKENSLPFVAEHGVSYRFFNAPAAAGATAPAQRSLTGKWAIEIQTKEPAPNQVALLRQDGNRLDGVFMTVVGDTRELEGNVENGKFYLSGFTGPSPILVKGTIDETGRLDGAISFGLYRTIRFQGHKQADVELPDPYKLTYLKPGFSKLNFTFPDLNGNPVSLSDDKYKGKVVIVEIIGTWCPNCTDQTRFLAPWFRENQHRGVEAIAIGFEQVDSLDYARTTLGRFKEFFDIRYDLLFGGIADKKIATDKLQGLNFMAAFPTTILIDRKGDVRQIYTGYTGQITGQYYQDYVKRFNRELDALLAEPVPESVTPTTADNPAGDPQHGS
ncbi:MAG: TlpA disulfide reductase family protein [Steroidobacteraceae bacterium]|jgi:peroxiredoxin